MPEETKINAEVLSVFPNKIRIEVKDINNFKVAEERLSVGSYLRISDSDDCAIMGIIDNFCIEKDEEKERHYIIECIPIGFLNEEGKFLRGGNNIAIPPIGVEPAKKEEIQKIYNQIEEKKRFIFSKLSQNISITVPIDGDRFFNKHVAIIGSTGCGKSCTLAKIIQEAIDAKESKYEGLNNSHIIIFDIHDEYHEAFPKANYINIDNLILPYWLMNGDELEELFVETGDNQAYNQTSLLRRVITRNKQKMNNNDSLIFDTPIRFSINEAMNCIVNLTIETRDYKIPSKVMVKGSPQTFDIDEKKYDYYYSEIKSFDEPKRESVSKGTYNDGSLEKFISRIKNKLSDDRLSFLLGDKANSISFEDVLKQFLAYKDDNKANVTIIDLSGVPFEVLSITVSLISRIIFEYGYYFKKADKENRTPLLMVYEEAHKYVPKLQSAKYNSSRISIERIAKEGRKYGVTLIILSQRPSEISETIFSQCNNFIAMRLTNPDDQNYVKRLLPDSLGPLTESLAILESGEAIIIGDSIVMPSLIKVDRCACEPSSHDIPYLQEWKKKWYDVKFELITSKWVK